MELQERLAKAFCGTEGGKQTAPSPSFLQKKIESDQTEGGNEINNGLEKKQAGRGTSELNNTKSLRTQGRKSAKGRR